LISAVVAWDCAAAGANDTRTIAAADSIRSTRTVEDTMVVSLPHSPEPSRNYHFIVTEG
jgi:hypothetical protein